VVPNTADIVTGIEVQLFGDFDVNFNTGTLGVFFTNAQDVKDPFVDSMGMVTSFSTTEIRAITPTRPAPGDFNVYVGAYQGLDYMTSNMLDFSFTFAGLAIHSADINSNNIIDLTELLRVIQFFNLNGFHCQTGTEDGFQPGTGGDISCQPHSSDYNPQNWVINLPELLRLIQLFNVGGYIVCPDANTEDGFCPVIPG
jgi:hypothetical protein